MEKTPTILSIGDILIDAFIKLKDARVTCDIDDANCTISMRWGDKIPYEKLTVVPAVGNAPNASVSVSRMGAESYLLSHVGNDEHGKTCLDALKKNGVSTDYVITEDGQDTNYHFVLSYEAERTILIKHAEFNYDLKNQIKDFVPDWIYLTSVAENSIPYHHAIASWVKENNIKMAFQPGTFQISLGYEQLKDIYEATEIFFCNKEEAIRILTPVIELPNQEMHTLLQEMHKLGPSIVCITDGPNGAYAYDGTEAWFVPMYPDPKPPVDRTGAGDSFSSTFTTCIAMGMSLGDALLRGPINSMSVVQYIGAQEGLLPREKLEEYLKNAPEDYKATKVI